jgi:gamma-glutamylcyclotransferase (GGCT)/AIG2-like uncharacterized protein YtfP
MLNHYLWVYGTLRRGESNHHFLTGCPLLGMVHYPGSLFSVRGHYPVFRPSLSTKVSSGSVLGELYQIQPALWPRLDELEGVEEGYYQRASFPISAGLAPRNAQAIVYVVGPLLESFCREEHLIPSGDWCQRSSFSL